MKVLVLTVGHAHVASTQYRFGQFEAGLRSAGIQLSLRPAVGFNAWSEIVSQDLVIVQKRLMRSSWVKLLRKHARCLIFDTDDAIWHPHSKPHSWWTQVRTRHRLLAITRAANLCTVPNEHLASHLRTDARLVEVVPMALDEAVWYPSFDRAPGPLRVGWAGAPANLTYLELLGDVLREIQLCRPGIELVIYCGKTPNWGDSLKFTHHPFVPGTEADILRSFDIGLLPLPDDAFAAGKSPIKALQYAACGIPCIASPVGATCELVRDGVTGLTAVSSEDWKQALLRLIDDAGERHRLGQAARRCFLQNYTREKVQDRLISCWMSLMIQTSDQTVSSDNCSTSNSSHFNSL